MITIQSNYTDMFAELDRVGSMPTPRMLLNLGSVLEFGFTEVRDQVDVDTGKLKASGKVSTKANKHDWSGKFSFPARNKKGTTYGIYELERGGSHNFFAGVGFLRPLFKEAIKDGLRRK